MVDHQHGFQFRSSGSKRIHLGSRCSTNLMPGRYLRLVVLQEILRGAGCCVFHCSCQCCSWRDRLSSVKASCFFVSVFNGVCMSLLSVGRSRNELWGVGVMFIIVQNYEEIRIDLKAQCWYCWSSMWTHVSWFPKENTSKTPHQAPWHRSRRSIFPKKPERSTGFGSSSTTPASPLRFVGSLWQRVQLIPVEWYKAAIRNSQGIHLWLLRINFRNIFQFQVHSTLFCCFPFLWSIEYSLVLQTYYRRL